jgi:hypothetical protein
MIVDAGVGMGLDRICASQSSPGMEALEQFAQARGLPQIELGVQMEGALAALHLGPAAVHALL